MVRQRMGRSALTFDRVLIENLFVDVVWAIDLNGSLVPVIVPNVSERTKNTRGGLKLLSIWIQRNGAEF